MRLYEPIWQRLKALMLPWSKYNVSAVFDIQRSPAQAIASTGPDGFFFYLLGHPEKTWHLNPDTDGCRCTLQNPDLYDNKGRPFDAGRENTFFFFSD